LEPSDDRAPGQPTEGQTESEGNIPLDYTPEGTTTALIVVVGPRGGGKTTLMAALTPQLAPPDRTIVVSPVGAIGKKLGLPVEIRYGSDKTNEEYFEKILDGGKRVVLVMDEFDEFCPASVQSKFGGYCCDALYRLVNYARNSPWCIGMLVSFRGASDVTTNLLRAATVLFVARTQEPNALDYFSRYLGREYAPMLRNLPNYVFVVWADGRLYGYVKVVDGELQWIDPPKGWPRPNANASSAAAGSGSTDTSAPPIESEGMETMPVTNASESSTDG
jgi:energy-coupling factor transporter ATP-binding protein EcfA2